MGRRLGGEELYSCESCALRPALKTMLGHDGPPTSYWRENLVNGEKLERCPVRTLQLADPQLDAEVTRHVAEYFPFYDDGHLLAKGGIADQPARYLAYMSEIRRLRAVVNMKYTELNEEGE